MGDLRPELGFSSQIQAMILGFGPFCFDLGHIAWIWAIEQNLGQNRPQRRRNEDGARGIDIRTDVMYGRTDGQISHVLQEFVPFGAAAQKPLKQGMGTSDY